MNSTLIKSPARVATIREMYYARAGVPVPSLLPVTKREINQTAKEVAAVTNDDNDITDEEIRGVESALKFESVRIANEIESDILLRRSEKAQLMRDVDAYRWAQGRARNNWLVVQSR